MDEQPITQQSNFLLLVIDIKIRDNVTIRVNMQMKQVNSAFACLQVLQCCLFVCYIRARSQGLWLHCSQLGLLYALFFY
jgi:hypothetical protein